MDATRGRRTQAFILIEDGGAILPAVQVGDAGAPPGGQAGGGVARAGEGRA